LRPPGVKVANLPREVARLVDAVMPPGNGNANESGRPGAKGER
jgi:hypothetical protein